MLFASHQSSGDEWLEMVADQRPLHPLLLGQGGGTPSLGTGTHQLLEEGESRRVAQRGESHGQELIIHPPDIFGASELDNDHDTKKCAKIS